VRGKQLRASSIQLITGREHVVVPSETSRLARTKARGWCEVPEPFEITEAQTTIVEAEYRVGRRTFSAAVYRRRARAWRVRRRAAN
jgi:hypothetical protein